MSSLDFIAALVNALAWPIVVLVVVLIFRKKIAEVLSERMTRLKAGLSRSSGPDKSQKLRPSSKRPTRRHRERVARQLYRTLESLHEAQNVGPQPA